MPKKVKQEKVKQAKVKQETGHPKVRVAVVGGGLAGLYVARESERRQANLTLFERNDHTGGRVVTMERYECAAFRVRDEHRAVRALCAELGVDLAPWHLRRSLGTSHTKVRMKARKAKTCHASRGGAGENSRYMTLYDKALATFLSRAQADACERGTGFDASYESVVPSHVADVTSEHYWYAPDGLQQITDALRSQLRAKVQHAAINCVERQDNMYYLYDVTGSRYGPYDKVVLAVTAIALRSISFRGPNLKLGANHVAHAVDMLPLMRIYARVDRDPFDGVSTVRVMPDSPLGQALSIPAFPAAGRDGTWVQVSYTEGRLARFWQDVRMAGRESFNKLVAQLVLRDLGVHVSEVDAHYWHNAVSCWAPGAEPCEAAVTRFPGSNIFLANESWSLRNQAWMEGSLESANRAIAAMWEGAYTLPRMSLRPGLMKVGPFLLQVALSGLGRAARASSSSLRDGHRSEDWSIRHPGGEGAIRAYDGRDATDMFLTMHAHSTLPWRFLLGMICGQSAV